MVKCAQIASSAHKKKNVWTPAPITLPMLAVRAPGNKGLSYFAGIATRNYTRGALKLGTNDEVQKNSKQLSFRNPTNHPWIHHCILYIGVAQQVRQVRQELYHILDWSGIARPEFQNKIVKDLFLGLS